MLVSLFVFVLMISVVKMGLLNSDRTYPDVSLLMGAGLSAFQSHSGYDIAKIPFQCSLAPFAQLLLPYGGRLGGGYSSFFYAAKVRIFSHSIKP